MSKHKGLHLIVVYGQKERHIMIFPLEKIPENFLAKVVAVRGRDPLRQRLLDLGFTPNARVKLKGRAPLGDPIIVSLRETTIALRKDEAKNIMVEDFTLQKD